MSVRFSLILPVYNVQAYLTRCIRSILAQAYTDDEIILVDDGATDGSPAICDEYAARYDFIRVIHKENGGLSSARNAGLAEAAGEYVWFVDSDDWIEPDALETLRAACESRPDVVKFGYLRVDGQTTQVLPGVQPGTYETAEALEALRREAFCAAGRYILSAWSHVYRRDFLLEHGLTFVSERRIGSEDYLFNLTALQHIQRMTVLDRALYSYELRGGSLTQQYKPDLFRRYTALYQGLCEAYSHDEARRYAALIDRFFVWHLTAGTGFSHEYGLINERHTMADARRAVREMLRAPEFRQAVKNADRTGLSRQRRVQLLAMRLRLEPLFHYLYVTKPGKKRG